MMEKHNTIDNKRVIYYYYRNKVKTLTERVSIL